jgi:hypothetical protein
MRLASVGGDEWMDEEAEAEADAATGHESSAAWDWSFADGL